MAVGSSRMLGLHALGRFADAVGLGAALSARIVPAGERFPLHDRGRCWCTRCSRSRAAATPVRMSSSCGRSRRCSGPVPSDSTLYRTYRQIDAATLAGLWDAMAEVRADVWSAVDTGERVVLDIDASLVEIHSEHKHGTAPTYKRRVRVPSDVLLRGSRRARRSPRCCGPGTRPRTTRPIISRSSTTRSASYRPRSRPATSSGDDPATVSRPVMVRADSAGATAGFVWGCRARNIGFAVVARKTTQIHGAISKIELDDDRWHRGRHAGR